MGTHIQEFWVDIVDI